MPRKEKTEHVHSVFGQVVPIAVGWLYSASLSSITYCGNHQHGSTRQHYHLPQLQHHGQHIFNKVLRFLFVLHPPILAR